MRFCKDHDIQPSLIILITWGNSGMTKRLNHPEADRAGHYPMPNLTSPEGAEAYGAILSFLAARYGDPDGPYGRPLNWIMHNEVDAGWVWTNMGQQPLLRFMDTYVYLWHKLRNMRNIDSYQNHGWFDHAGEGGLLLGLRTLRTKDHPWGTKKKAWHVYQALDTPEEAEATEFAKAIIGIEDFTEIPYQGTIK